MKSLKLIPIAALTLAMSASSALQADPPRGPEHGRYDDRYDRNDRYDNRRGRYDGRRIEAMAQEIEQTAYTIRREAERNNRRPDRRETVMLSALRELNQEADQFHAQVDNRRGGVRAERDFGELVRAYRETGRVVDRNDPRPYIDRGMERIGYLISEISESYGRRADYRWQNRDGRDWSRWDRN